MMTTTRRDYLWITDAIRDEAVSGVMKAIETGVSLSAACTEVAVTLDVHANTVKNWVVASGRLEATGRASRERVATLAAQVEALRATNRALVAAVKAQHKP